METMFGPRFNEEVKSLGLLDPPKPPPRPESRASISDRESGNYVVPINATVLNYFE